MLSKDDKSRVRDAVEIGIAVRKAVRFAIDVNEEYSAIAESAAALDMTAEQFYVRGLQGLDQYHKESRYENRR